MSLISPSKLLRLTFSSAAAIQFSQGVRACGPNFPNSYLSNTFDEITVLPTLSFDGELTRMLSVSPLPGLPAFAEAEDASSAEIGEVRKALVRAGLSAPAIEAAVSGYRRDQPPRSLPAEFQLYARGARAWHLNDSIEALAAWRELLALPPEQRRYRTVWAAYMIGRSLWASDPEHAREAFRLAQDAAVHGFSDSQGLAIASIGWEARSYLHQGDYTAALRGYYRQFALGDHSAVPSLQQTMQRVFCGAEARAASNGTPPASPDATLGGKPASDEILRELAEDKVLRGVVTAWFACRGGPSSRWRRDAAQQFGRWIRNLPKSGNLPPDEADRWCWVSYQNGYWDEARAFAELAPPEAPASEWVRAMLLLRSGAVDNAAAHLAIAARSFGTDPVLGRQSPEWQPLQDAPPGQLNGVRGVLALRREQYVEALRLFLASNLWSDAAYVAERVLTVDELVAFVRSASGTQPNSPTPQGRSGHDLRHLLARRLVRNGRFDEAREFFPRELSATYATYVLNTRLGFDAKQSPGSRAAAFWAAAQVIHDRGMEIQGTELEPDYFIWDGNHEWPGLAGARSNLFASNRPPAERAAIMPTAGELERTGKATVPQRRFHYRYRAAELAWLAAALLPDDDPQTAMVLNTAGCWIDRRDKEQAELFYKMLVIRCPNTDLGRKAAARHWLVRS